VQFVSNLHIVSDVSRLCHNLESSVVYCLWSVCICHYCRLTKQQLRLYQSQRGTPAWCWPVCWRLQLDDVLWRNWNHPWASSSRYDIPYELYFVFILACTLHVLRFHADGEPFYHAKWENVQALKLCFSFQHLTYSRL